MQDTLTYEPRFKLGSLYEEEVGGERVGLPEANKKIEEAREEPLGLMMRFAKHLARRGNMFRIKKLRRGEIEERVRAKTEGMEARLELDRKKLERRSKQG